MKSYNSGLALGLRAEDIFTEDQWSHYFTLTTIYSEGDDFSEKNNGDVETRKEERDTNGQAEMQM